MAKCPVCDHHIDEGVEFCPSCGSRLGWSGPGREDPAQEAEDGDQSATTRGVSLLADPSLVQIAPGGTAVVRLTINNHTGSEATFQVVLTPDGPLRTSVEPSETMRVSANQSVVVVLTVELPAHLDMGGSTQIAVTVRSTSDPQKTVSQVIQIRPLTTGAVLSARQVRRSGLRSVTFDARLTNNGNQAVEWTPMGSAPDDVDVAVAPSPLVVPAGESAQFTVAATAERLNWGSPREHRITVGGPAEVVTNRLDFVFSQSSVVWPAVAGVVLAVVALVLLIGALDGGTSAPGTTLAAGTSTSTTSTTVVSTTAGTTPATTTATTVADTTPTGPEGDLGISGYEMVVPSCDDQYITVLFSAIEPGAYEEQVASNLEAYPDSNYLRTDQSCSSLRQEIEGNPIYAVFYGPFETTDEACDALADENSYVRLLSETTPSNEATVDC